MDPKLSKKIKKRLSKILPKPETISNKFHEIQSDFRKFAEEFTGSRSVSVDLDSSASADQNSDSDASNYPPPYSIGEFDMGESSSKMNKTNSDSTSDVVCTDNASASNLSSDFQSLLENGYFTDVLIKCGSEELKAHKCVLSARSSVFHAMFNTPMLESKRDKVTIDDIEPSVLRALLSFVYTGQVKNIDVPIACGLLQSAEKYQIDSLKNVCISYLKENISIENCLSVLQRTELFSEDLKNDVVAFICDVFSVLQLTQDWTDLQKNDPPLALKIYSSVVGKLQAKK